MTHYDYLDVIGIKSFDITFERNETDFTDIIELFMAKNLTWQTPRECLSQNVPKEKPKEA